MAGTFQAKGTLFFSSGVNGWSESYYLTGADYTSAAAQLVTVSAARRAILQMDLTCTYAYVSNVFVRGDSYPVVAAEGVGTWPTSPEFMPLDYAIQQIWTVGPYSRNRTFLHGFPLEQQTDGAYIPTSPFITAMTAYTGTILLYCVFLQTVVNPTPPPATIKQYNVPLGGTQKFGLARRKIGRPFGLPRGRRVAI